MSPLLLAAAVCALLAGLLLSTQEAERRLVRIAPAAADSGGGAQGPDDRRRADPDAAIALIDRAAALLRVGLPAHAVVGELAAAAPEGLAEPLRLSARSLSLGEDVRTAVRRHLGGVPADQREVLEAMAAVWHVALISGAPAADMLSRCAASRRALADAHRERDVALAGPQATVTVLTWLPAGGFGLALLIGADLLALLSSPPGAILLGAGAALMVIGRLWMRRMLGAVR